jgi:hypothetical protein
MPFSLLHTEAMQRSILVLGQHSSVEEYSMVQRDWLRSVHSSAPESSSTLTWSTEASCYSMQASPEDLPEIPTSQNCQGTAKQNFISSDLKD